MVWGSVSLFCFLLYDIFFGWWLDPIIEFFKNLIIYGAFILGVVLAFWILAKIISYLINKPAGESRAAKRQRTARMQAQVLLPEYVRDINKFMKDERGIEPGDRMLDDDYVFLADQLVKEAEDDIKDKMTPDKLMRSTGFLMILISFLQRYRAGLKLYATSPDGKDRMDISKFIERRYFVGKFGYTEDDWEKEKKCYEALSKRTSIKQKDLKDQLDFVKGEENGLMSLPRFIAETFEELTGSERILDWLNASTPADRKKVYGYLADLAETNLKAGRLRVSASLLLSAYSLALGEYMDERYFSMYSFGINEMLDEMLKNGALTEESCAYRKNLVKTLDAIDHVVSEELIRDAIPIVRREVEMAFIVPVEIHTKSMRDMKVQGDAIIVQEAASAVEAAPEEPSYAEQCVAELNGFIAGAEKDLKAGGLIDAAVKGRHFLERILKEYCEAAGVDRSSLGLMEQIDYFKDSGMLEEREVSHLHQIRIVSNKGAHYDKTITADDVSGMIRHMRAEVKLFGIT